MIKSYMVQDIISFFRTLGNNVYRSVKSVDFYKEVYHYHGYGLKYLFSISFFISIVYCSIIFNNISKISNDILNNSSSKSAILFEHLVNQFPIIYYNGNSINLEDDVLIPYYINDQIGRNIVGIDLDNKISFSDRKKIPILLTKNNIIVNFIDTSKSANQSELSFPIEYKKILDSYNKQNNSSITTITPLDIKEYLISIINKIPRVFIYFITPVMILIRFIIDIPGLIIFAVLLYFVAKFTHSNTSFKTSIRMVCFAEGGLMIFDVISKLILDTYGNLLSGMLQIWVYYLMTSAILKMRK